MAFQDKLASMSKKPAAKFDDPEDELTQPPHNEPDGDEGYIDELMGKSIEGNEEASPFQGDPLEGALVNAGFQVTPEQLMQIQSILQPKPAPAAKPAMGGAPAGAAKPPFIGADASKKPGLMG